MKRIMLAVFLLMILSVMLGGCFPRIGGSVSQNAKTSATPPVKDESVPTLDEVISGTWELYAGFDEKGDYVLKSDDWAEMSFTFDEKNGFSGAYNDGDSGDYGYVRATFKGTYDVTNSQLSEKDPYKWIYYATIDKDSITDTGEGTMFSRFGGEEGLYLSFRFREKDGEMLLYEEVQKVYFRKK